MTDTLITASDQSYASKIAKLLARAEHPNTPEPEADSCIAKAQELMITYAIDQELIDRARGKQRAEKIVRGEPVIYAGSFRMATMEIGWAVARANNLRGFREDCVAAQSRRAGEPQHIKLHPIGFESDIERYRLLDSSLQVQCASAQRAWWKSAKNEPEFALLSGTDQHKARRQFIFSFADGVRSRLAQARKHAEQEAIKHETERTGAVKAAASESVALVVQGRRKQVDDWFDVQYGKSTRTVNRNYTSGGRNAAEAGRAAAQSANLGQPGVGQRKAIG